MDIRSWTAARIRSPASLAPRG